MADNKMKQQEKRTITLQGRSNRKKANIGIAKMKRLRI